MTARLAAIIAHALPGALAAGQERQPAGASAPGSELPADLVRALHSVEDFAFRFDQAGYYAVLEHVKRSGPAPGHAREPTELEDWRVLLERPSDFRGQPITIEGVVGRNKSPYRHKDREQLGLVWQLELHRPDQPIASTVICTNDVSDIPIGATIRVTGYFVMVRQYYDHNNRARQALLLVAPGPSLVVQPTAVEGKKSSHWTWLVAAAVAGLLVVWVLLRQTTRDGREIGTPHARRPAPTSLADDLSAWAQRERPQAEDTLPNEGMTNDRDETR